VLAQVVGDLLIGVTHEADENLLPGIALGDPSRTQS